MTVWRACLLLLLLACAPALGATPPVVLQNDTWRVTLDPATLSAAATPRGQASVELSAPQPDLGPVAELTQDATHARWHLAKAQCDAQVQLSGDTVTVQLQSAPETSITWPVLQPRGPVRAYVLPLDEGSYVPVTHAEWIASLSRSSPMSTTEGLSLPFWGLDCGAYSLTYVLTNPFHNELSFTSHEARLGLRLTHEFLRISPEPYRVLITLGAPSPVGPARVYRQWLISQGQFVSLQEKIDRTPEAAKLVGAAHAYLWGSALLSRYDVRNWPRFARALVAQGRAGQASPGGRLWALLSKEARAGVEEIATTGHAYPALTRDAADAISDVLARPDFYQAEAWRGVTLPADAQALLARGPSSLPLADLLRLNALLLQAAFPADLLPPDQWGDGVSTKMMARLSDAGLDRLWLGLDSWQGGFRHPQAIRAAKAAGYLIGTYDSYESIHRPGETDTWETAQFDQHLYDTGAVLRRNGKPIRGFQQKGYRLSPLAAWPAVQARVTGLMRDLPERLNSWFIDCDAYGDLEDDYSPLHPATQQQDMEARLQRMQWIRDTYGLVIGSERGAGYAAPVIHFAHGMMTPVIGWGDPDLQKDKQSKYYLGAWWPADGPSIMLKQVPLKPAYYTRFFDPRYRLPLYQTVFHDSLVTTHHWQYASLKLSDQTVTTELQELLYGVPPLYHLNLEAFGKDRPRIVAHYRFFSPLHREIALLPLTDFTWLTPDHLVQRTVFGDQVEVIANFTPRAYSSHGASVPARSILVRHRTTGQTQTYTPRP